MTKTTDLTDDRRHAIRDFIKGFIPEALEKKAFTEDSLVAHASAAYGMKELGMPGDRLVQVVIAHGILAESIKGNLSEDQGTRDREIAIFCVGHLLGMMSLGQMLCTDHPETLAFREFMEDWHSVVSTISGREN